MASNGIRDLIQQNLLQSLATGKNQAYITPQATLQAQQKAQQQAIAQQQAKARTQASTASSGTKNSVRDLYEQNLLQQLATNQPFQQASMQAHRLTNEQATEQRVQQDKQRAEQQAQQRAQQQTQTQNQPQAQAQPQAATPAQQRVFVEPTLLTTAQDAYANRGTPYADLAKAYEERTRANLTAQEEAMAKQLAASKAATAAEYDSAAASNYLNYVKQRNALPEQLARLGVRGGASESALARIGNNYAMNQGNTTAQRYAAYGQLQNAYNNNLANMRQTAEENILNNNLALQQNQIQYDDTLAQRAAEESRYNQELVRAARERFEDIEREDQRLKDTWAREDALTAAANEREDARYREEVERAIRERNEDIAREDERYKQEQKTAAQQYKDEQKWKETEFEYKQTEDKIEDYAAGLLRYVGDKGIKSLEKLRKDVKAKHKDWASSHYWFGVVKAIDNRIGVIRTGNK